MENTIILKFNDQKVSCGKGTNKAVSQDGRTATHDLSHIPPKVQEQIQGTLNYILLSLKILSKTQRGPPLPLPKQK